MVSYPGQACIVCGALYEGHTTRRVYCSRACNLRAFHARRSGGLALLLKQHAALLDGDVPAALELARRAEPLFPGASSSRAAARPSE